MRETNHLRKLANETKGTGFGRTKKRSRAYQPTKAALKARVSELSAELSVLQIRVSDLLRAWKAEDGIVEALVRLEETVKTQDSPFVQVPK